MNDDKLNIINSAKQFLSRILNTVQVISSVVISGSGIGLIVKGLTCSEYCRRYSDHIPGGLALAILAPFVIHGIRKTLDYIFNLKQESDDCA